MRERVDTRAAGEADAANPARATDRRRGVMTRDCRAQAGQVLCAAAAAAPLIRLRVKADAVLAAGVEAGISNWLEQCIYWPEQPLPRALVTYCLQITRSGGRGPSNQCTDDSLPLPRRPRYWMLTDE